MKARRWGTRLAFLAIAATSLAPRMSRAQDVVVRGVVRGPQGAPVAQAEIIVGDSSRARTDSAGRFTVVGLTAGSTELLVRRVGFAPVAVPLTLSAGQRRNLAIELAAVPYAIDPVLITARRPGLYGQVVGEDGKPLQGADVIVIGANRRMKSGADGAFAFPELLNRASYIIQVRAVDHVAAQFSVTLPPDRGAELHVQLANLDPSLSPGARELAAGFWARDDAILAQLDHRLRVNQTLLVTRADLAKQGSRSLQTLLAENLATYLAIPPSDRTRPSIDPRGTEQTASSSALAALNRPGVCYFVDGVPALDVAWLQQASASWIESIEVTRDDRTGTLRRLLADPQVRCSQFIVVWLRR